MSRRTEPYRSARVGIEANSPASVRGRERMADAGTITQPRERVRPGRRGPGLERMLTRELRISPPRGGRGRAYGSGR